MMPKKTTFPQFIGIESKLGQIKEIPPYTNFLAGKIGEKLLMDISVPRMLIVTMPPRSYKTTISSYWLPTWIYEYVPYKTIGIFSYSEDIVNVNIKRLSPGLRQKIVNLNTYSNTPIDVFIIDDYCKSDVEGESDLYNDRTYKSFINTTMHLMPNAFILIMATRWNKNDLVGRILANIGTGDLPFLIDYINLQSIASAYDPLERSPGEPLWKDKYPQSYLAQLRKTVSEKWFKTIYQGRPI